jgi:hypothetical protein
MSIGDLVTISTSTAIGGISSGNLNQTATAITSASTDYFEYTAGASASSTASGSLNKVLANDYSRPYPGGESALVLFLNGQRLRRNDDWSEISNTQIQINQTLVLGDILTYWMDT